MINVEMVSTCCVTVNHIPNASKLNYVQFVKLLWPSGLRKIGLAISTTERYFGHDTFPQDVVCTALQQGMVYCITTMCAKTAWDVCGSTRACCAPIAETVMAASGKDPKPAQHGRNMSAVNDGVHMWLRLPPSIRRI